MPTPPLSAELRAEALTAWEAAGRNGLAAAGALGLPYETFRHRLRLARTDLAETAVRGVAPAYGMDTAVPDPFLVKGKSSYFKRDPKTGAATETAFWLKTKLDDQVRAQMILDTLEDRAARIEPLPTVPDPGAAPAFAGNTRLNMVTLTDCHIGMLAWDKETGGDWDLGIARDTLTRTFVGILRALPPARTCIINQLGDFLHFDGLKPVTPAHGNVLDADSRYQKMAGMATDVLENIVLEALRLHERVHVILAEGNHDESGSVWLRVMFRRLFRDNPRVTIDDSPLPYYAYRHGKTLLGFHHGHISKMEQLPGLFAAEPRFRAMWGETTRTYIHVGHHHCHEVIEKNGAEVERHPTLAERDAYAARGGYIADRRAFGITYDEELGEVGRISATPDTYR